MNKLMDFILRNRWLKLLAIFLAVLTWVYVSQQSYKTDIIREVPVQFGGLTISSGSGVREYFILAQTWRTLELTVSGPTNAMDQLRKSRLVAEVDVARRATGSLSGNLDSVQNVSVQILPEDILNLPPGITVSQIKPREISLTLDEIDEKQMVVDIDHKRDLRGELKSGLRIANIYPIPKRVIVRGPRSVLAARETIHPADPLPIGNIQDAMMWQPERTLDRWAIINDRPVECLRPDPAVVKLWIEIRLHKETAKIKDVPIEVRGRPDLTYVVLDMTKTRPMHTLPEIEIRGPGSPSDLEKATVRAYLDLFDIADPKAKPETTLAVQFDHAPEIEIVTKPPEVVVQIKSANVE